MEKNEVSQCEVDLNFRTNRFFTAVTGYVRVNNVSLATNLKLDYQLDNSKQEYVRLEIHSADRSTRHKSQLLGNVTLISSAYPQINTILHINYQVRVNILWHQNYCIQFFKEHTCLLLCLGSVCIHEVSLALQPPNRLR